MGLDMYLYKATKPSLTFGIYRSDDIYIQSLALIPNDEHNEEMYSAIKPYMVRIQLESSEYDAEKIAKDYGLKGRIGICSISPDGISVRGENKTTDYRRIYTERVPFGNWRRHICMGWRNCTIW